MSMVLSNNTIGVYIHVPYCIRKCRYCDFVSFERPPEEGYFAELAEDIKAAKNANVKRFRQEFCFPSPNFFL